MDSWKAWFQKYFMVEQTVQNVNIVTRTDDKWINFVNEYRQLISIAVPVVLVQLLWWIFMIITDWFVMVFDDKIGTYSQPRYYLAIAMVFGSMIAGSTSEGGAAIAFPILTLLMGVSPSIARDFSFMIQSIGMSCASFSIFFMKVKLEYSSLVYCTIGGTIGVLLGLEYVAPYLAPAYTKMIFVSVWFAFAM